MLTLGFDFIERWYGLDATTALNKFQLVSSKVPAILEGLPFTDAGLFLDASELESIGENPYICSGVCITDCIPSLTLECIAKIYNLVSVAARLKATAILFVGLHGEKLKYEGLSVDWDNILIKISRLTRLFANEWGLQNYHICNTEDFYQNDAIDKVCEQVKGEVPVDVLLNIYEIGKTPGKNLQGTAAQIEATINCVAFNSPRALAELYDKQMSLLIYLEDLQQTNVIALARALDQSGITTKTVYFCPFPGLNGQGRMYRSPPSQKIYCSDSILKLHYQFAAMDKQVLASWLAFFQTRNDMFLPDTPKRLAEIVGSIGVATKK